jgi:predicted Zn-dependent protease
MALVRTRLSTLALAALLAACGSQVKNPVTGETERTVMNEQQEVAQGAKAHEEILKEYGVVKNPRLQTYVNEVGQKLAAQSHRAQLKWTFTVLDSPEINAFALPGGYVYLTRGIMAYLDSEADMAGVIGHEIGHVTARHGAQRATRQQNAAIGALLGGILGAVLDASGGGGVGRVIGDASQAAAAGYVARYSREQELQADGLGAEYLNRVNYDPRNMIDVIRVLKDQERYAAEVARAEGRPAPQGNSWLASHPSNDERLNAITRITAQYAVNKNFADEGRMRYLQMIDGMAFGETAEQGLTRGNQFYHEPLNFAITAFSGWKIMNDEAQITIINPARDAGLIMQIAPEKAGRTHDEIIRNAVRPVSGNTNRYQVNGLPVTHFNGVARSQNGQQSAVTLSVITSASGQNFIAQYAAKDANALARNRSVMQQIEASFRPLSAADKAAAKPWLVRSAPYPRGGFAELARATPLSTLPEQQIRLMNGLYGGGEPKPGSAMKVVAQQ